MVPLAPLTLGQCAAIVDDRDHPRYHASMQRILLPGDKRCSRKAKEQVGHLHLCATHARLACEGFIAEDGRVADRNAIRDYRDYPEKLGTMHKWAKP
jgi:hypothetical protein